MSGAKRECYCGSDRPHLLAPVMGNVPASLRTLPQWIAWIVQYQARRDEWVKLPIDCRTGRLAKSNDPARWTTFERAADYHRRCHTAGVGFVFASGDPFCGIDLDSVRDPATGAVEPVAAKLIARIGTYAEVSPSGTGIKLFGIGRLPTGIKHSIGKVEVYDRLRYFAVTGWRVGSITEPQPCQAQLDRLVTYLMPRAPCEKCRPPLVIPADRVQLLLRVKAYLRKVPPAIAGQRGHDRTFYVAKRLIQEFALSDDEAREAIADWNATCQPPWSAKEIEHKINSARNRIDPARLGELLVTRRSP